ncbi:MAG TPA: glycosyltransferase family 4 protein [bacterium]|nr:glycosyltransferase family 4 protein [bacterium]
MKIAVFTKSTTLHKNHGGLETQNLVLCEELAKRGYNITVFSPKKELQEEFAEKNGVKYVFIDADYRNYLFSKFRKNSWGKKSLEVFSEWQRRENFDIVLSQSAAAEKIIEKKHELNVKTVSIAHGTAASEYSTFLKNIKNVKDFYWALRNTQYFFRQYFGRQRRYILHSDKVIAVSEYVKKALISETFVDENKVSVIHNGVNGNLYKNEKKNRNVGGVVDLYFIGRIEVSKGILTLLDMVRDINRNIILHVVGEGPCLEKAMKKVGKDKIQEKVVFHGKMPHNEFIKKINPDIFVFPTQRVEGFPMVLVESMFAGIPVVAFDLGGVSDAVADGKTGYLVKAGDNKYFKEKLIELIDDDKLRLELGKNAEEKAQREFTIDRMVDKYEEVFLEVTK